VKQQHFYPSRILASESRRAISTTVFENIEGAAVDKTV